MTRNKRKDMPKHIRALLTPQPPHLIKPGEWAVFDLEMRYAPLKALKASGGTTPVPATRDYWTKIRPQNGCS